MWIYSRALRASMENRGSLIGWVGRLQVLPFFLSFFLSLSLSLSLTFARAYSTTGKATKIQILQYALKVLLKRKNKSKQCQIAILQCTIHSCEINILELHFIYLTIPIHSISSHPAFPSPEQNTLSIQSNEHDFKLPILFYPK